jgi:acyl transferase domain-containing protein/acyl carrier protein
MKISTVPSPGWKKISTCSGILTMTEIKSHTRRTGMEVAVIGMAGRFPGAGSIARFWENLKQGIESTWFFSDDDLVQSGTSPHLVRDPHFVRVGAILEDADYFDSDFFDYRPNEAALMNPQTRIFHECAWEALENAGYVPESYNGLIGLYAGASSSFEWEALSYLFHQDEQGMDPTIQFEAHQLTNKDFLGPKIAYKLNLKGPVLTLNTACSTSLVAIHLACRALLTAECKMALAGGVSVSSASRRGYVYREGMIMSPDGRCRAFDAGANGTVDGDGVGVVVLKLLEDAESDGDFIHAVIKATAINNDGSRKVGFSAPSVEGQAQVIQRALRTARVEPDTIGYIETHGTGTPLGDPTEIQALKLAFDTSRKGFCRIGSIKTNVGHLDAAAGVAGLIKVVLALKHGLIPPSLHFKEPNPEIDFENSPFDVNTTLHPWKSNGTPLRAGVSSFGIGGTNAHVILEQVPPDNRPLTPPDREHQLILLSAKTPSALDRMTENLLSHLKQNPVNPSNPANPGSDPANIAYTLQVGRKTFKHRRMLVCATAEEAVNLLSSPAPGQVRTAEAEERKVVFMFPGQGAQYVDMGLGLYQRNLVFRETMDRCFEILNPLTNRNIKELLYPGEAAGKTRASANDAGIQRTDVAQPLLFAVEYALAELLMKWGIKPFAMIGHSLGEYTAACLAGVFPLENALELVVLRGKLMQQMPTGAMVSVPLCEEEITPLLDETVSLAAVNGLSCVVSGPHDAVDRWTRGLKEKGYEYRRLHTSHAFHSAMMDPVLEEFKQAVAAIPLSKPKIPYISNLTGTWAAVDDASDPNYWMRHLRHTVRFSDGLGQLLKEENALLVEVGPGNTLSKLAKQHKDKKSGQMMAPLLRHPKEQIPDDRYLLDNIGQLWLHGVKPDWAEFHPPGTRRRVPLPTYPFERHRYKQEGNLLKQAGDILPRRFMAEKKPDIADWFYMPSWRRSGLAADTPGQLPSGSCFLVFVDDRGIGEPLAEQLKAAGNTVIQVMAGTAFKKSSPDLYEIDPRTPGHYRQLFDALQQEAALDEILHLWSISPTVPGELSSQAVDDTQDRGFYSLLHIVQSMESHEHKRENSIRVTAVTNGVLEVTGEEDLAPGKAMIRGLLNVLPQEYPGIRCRCIDIVMPFMPVHVHQLLSELVSGSSDPVVAYRGYYRWRQRFEPIRLESVEETAHPLKEGGVYLVTGGLGGVGLILAQYLAKAVKARLILTGRSSFPESGQWREWLASHQEEDAVSQKIRRLKALEEEGAAVLVCQADAADEVSMQKAIARAEKAFGPVNGVIHAAAVTGEKALGIVSQIGKDQCREQFRPKVHGLLVLERLFRDKPLDFCFLTSSLAAILGGLGFAAYSAANIFMDVFARKQSRHGKTPWISANWEGWRLEETEKRFASGSSRWGGQAMKLALTPEEGADAFRRVLSCVETRQPIISTAHLRYRIDRWIKNTPSQQSRPGEKQETGSVSAPPVLSDSYEAPQDPLRKWLVNIWEKLFGGRTIGIRDDFFDIGGDSLMLVQMHSMIDKRYPNRMEVQDLFDNRTIEKLARLITEKEKGPSHDKNETILKQVDF